MIANLFFSLWACTTADAERPGDAGARDVASPDATRVEIAALKHAPTSLTVRLPGEVEGHRDATLASATGGLVEAVLAQNGDEVKKGTVLVRVDADLYGAQLAQAEANLDQATYDLNQVEALGDMASEAQHRQAQTRARIAEATARQARLQVKRAVLSAPFDGVVAGLNIEPGEIVAPGAPVVRLVQLDPVTVSLSVSDRDVVALQPGAPAQVSTAAAAGTRSGVVASVSPAADVRTRTFEVKVTVPNRQQALLPGMIADVAIERDLGERIAVPQDWLITQRDTHGVFLASGDVATWREVVLGEIVRDRVVITGGLADGDRIVVTGHRDLAEGDALLVTREGVCCTDGHIVYANEP